MPTYAYSAEMSTHCPRCLTQAFKNKDYDNRVAKASHILVPSEEKALALKEQLLSGIPTF